MAEHVRKPDRENPTGHALSNEPASPLREAIEALSALGACLAAIELASRGSVGMDQAWLQDAIARCLAQHRRAADAIRLLRRLATQG